MRRILFILNPVSGNGKSHTALPAIKGAMEGSTISMDIEVSKFKGDVANIASRCLERGYTDIVAIGGDGTLSETVKGIYDSKRPFSSVNVGLIPFGTGNDFARSIGLDGDIAASVGRIIRGGTVKADIGIVNSRPFINAVSFGIDGQIIVDTDRIKRFAPGTSSYYLASLKGIATYKPFDVSLEVTLEDGSVDSFESECVMGVLGNGSYFGGGMKVHPSADPLDGLLDFCLVSDMDRMRMLSLFPKLIKGTHVGLKEVSMRRCTKVVAVNKGRDFYVNCDGELIGRNYLEAGLHDEKMSFLL